MTTGQILGRLFLILTMVGLMTSAWLFISWLYKPGNFPIKKVELVNQLENQESKELQKVAAKAINGGFFSLNVALFRADLLSSLPWVKAVSVRKIWPNKLLVSITEHKPVVRWLSVQQLAQQEKGRKQNMKQSESAMNTDSLVSEQDFKLFSFQLLSNEAIIFHPELTDKQRVQFNKLALLTGPESSADKVLETCIQINDSLKKLDSGIKSCGMNVRRTWMVILTNNMELKLGKKNVLQQLERFIQVFSGQLKHYLAAVDYADLRYANGFSIKWRSDREADSDAGSKRMGKEDSKKGNRNRKGI